MTTLTYIALPVLQQSYEFQLEKGRRWNVVEHMILQSVCKDGQSAGDISETGNMPRRVSLEALIRLMRAGWVELQTKGDRVLFVPTARGREVAKFDELPMTAETMNRRISFAFDLITGTVFKKRDLKLMREDEWKIFQKEKNTNEIQRPLTTNVDFGHSAAIMRTLVRDDEKVIKIKESQHPPLERLAIITVRGKSIDGLPEGDNNNLETILRDAATEKSVNPKGETSAPKIIVQPDRSNLKMRPIRNVDIRQNDYLLGGPVHKGFLNKVLLTARKIVIIHTTFLRANACMAFKENLLIAVNRGVRVHILWGQSDDQSGTSNSRQEAEELRKSLLEQGLHPNVTVHNASTGSHAKLIVADNGRNKYIATVGSCNWLSSEFISYEASVVLRDHRLVSDVLFEMSEMVRPSNRDFPEISAHFLELARKLSSDNGRDGGARVKILLGQDHDDYVLETRDKAQKQVDIISHRLGARALPSIILPMISAANDRGVSTKLYYSKSVNPVKFEDAQQTKIKIRQEGITLSAIHQPTVHAKILLRDDNFSILTSLNWLSADATQDQSHQEIGVLIESKTTAKFLREQFEFQVNGIIPDTEKEQF